MSDLDGSWPHLYTPGDADHPVLLTLHGTGSDERDIAQIAAVLDPEAAVLSPRGKVSENGMLRWFARRGEGVFDVDDVVFRAAELLTFTESAVAEYGLDGRPLIAVGLSNGANIALAAALLHPRSVSRVVAFSGMYPLGDRMPESAAASGGTAPIPLGARGSARSDSLAAVDVILLNGSADPMAPAASVDVLERVLRERGAAVRRITRLGGHGITQADVDAARAWL